jgi:spore maturation protein CgeB
VKIKIISLSDTMQNVNDGDYWVKKDLGIEFTKRGYSIVNSDADLDFYLFGLYSSAHHMSAPRRFCWVYSHPDLVGRKQWSEFAKQFEHIFVLSNSFILSEKFKNERNKTSVLLGASSKDLVFRKETKHDIIFVGSARHGKRLDAVKALIKLNKYKICLVGNGWDKALDGLIKNVDYKSYVDNHLLGNLFSQGLLSFYSAHEDMRLAGFVAVRILDIFRSSECLCISDENPGLKDIFRDIPTYKDEKDLTNKIDWFLENPAKRRVVTLKCREDVGPWTFTKTVKEIERWF